MEVQDAKMPTEMSHFECVTVVNDEYVILLVGYYSWSTSDDVWIYSVGDKKITKFNVKCPKRSAYEACTINDKKKNELITVGYVRKKWSECGICNYLSI